MAHVASDVIDAVIGLSGGLKEIKESTGLEGCIPSPGRKLTSSIVRREKKRLLLLGHKMVLTLRI